MVREILLSSILLCASSKIEINSRIFYIIDINHYLHLNRRQAGNKLCCQTFLDGKTNPLKHNIHSRIFYIYFVQIFLFNLLFVTQIIMFSKLLSQPCVNSSITFSSINLIWDKIGLCKTKLRSLCLYICLHLNNAHLIWHNADTVLGIWNIPT